MPDPVSATYADDCLRTGAEVRARGEADCCRWCGYPAGALPGDTPGAPDCAPPTRLETFTPDLCEQMFHAALAAGDARGVEAALLVMAPQDPHRAERLYNAVRVALAIRRPNPTGARPCMTR